MIQLSFLVTTLLFLLFFYLATGRNKRVLLVSIFWLILIGSFSLTGFFQNTNTVPPRFLIVLIGTIIFIVFLYKRLKTVIDYRKAMIVHALRIPVEITLYFLFLQNQVPEIMTLKGLNYDIIIGISALIFLILSQLFKINLRIKTFLIWNIIGLLFLMNIVVIAIISAPLPIQQLSFEQPNIAVLSFPYILLPSFIVPIVILTHIISLKQLAQR